MYMPVEKCTVELQICQIGSFQLSVVEPKPRQLLQWITTDRNSTMSQSEYETITCDRRYARENVRVRVVIGFVSHWFRKWRKFCYPIRERSKANAITFRHSLVFHILPFIVFRCRQFKAKSPKDFRTGEWKYWIKRVVARKHRSKRWRRWRIWTECSRKEIKCICFSFMDLHLLQLSCVLI